MAGFSVWPLIWHILNSPWKFIMSIHHEYSSRVFIMSLQSFVGVTIAWMAWKFGAHQVSDIRRNTQEKNKFSVSCVNIVYQQMHRNLSVRHFSDVWRMMEKSNQTKSPWRRMEKSTQKMPNTIFKITVSYFNAAGDEIDIAWWSVTWFLRAGTWHRTV